MKDSHGIVNIAIPFHLAPLTLWDRARVSLNGLPPLASAVALLSRGSSPGSAIRARVKRIGILDIRDVHLLAPVPLESGSTYETFLLDRGLWLKADWKTLPLQGVLQD